jgi:hypothetical protein
MLGFLMEAATVLAGGSVEGLLKFGGKVVEDEFFGRAARFVEVAHGSLCITFMICRQS